MNNARSIAALKKTIAQLTAVKDRLTAADEKAGNPAPAKKTSAKKSAKKAPAKKRAAKKTAKKA